MVGGIGLGGRFGMHIAVLGRSDGCTPEVYALAEAVGREIGARGHTLVCGGGNGVMEAACKGAKAAGGITIGILPGGDRATANAYVDYPIATGIGYARNALVVLNGDVCIAVGGEYGTLSEIGHALSFEKPVVGLKTWTLIRGDGEPERRLNVAVDPSDAVTQAESLGRGRLGG